MAEHGASFSLWMGWVTSFGSEFFVRRAQEQVVAQVYVNLEDVFSYAENLQKTGLQDITVNGS